MGVEAIFMAALPEMIDKDLISWCAAACHGDVLLTWCSGIFATRLDTKPETGFEPFVGFSGATRRGKV
ncbi:hypothetical protein ACC702_24540 [Rhizobium ruizarguesonis]